MVFIHTNVHLKKIPHELVILNTKTIGNIIIIKLLEKRKKIIIVMIKY